MSQEPTQNVSNPDAPSWPPSKIYGFARAAFTIGAIAATLLLAAPFLSSLTLALVLAVTFGRPHRFIESALKGPSLAASFSVLTVALIVVAPLLLISSRLIGEAVVGANYIQQQLAGSQWRDFINAHPWLETLNAWIEQQINLQDMLGKAASWMTNAGATVIRQSTSQILTILLSFYFLFFFLRDRRLALDTLERLSPFSGEETRAIFARVRDAIYATIYGIIVVAALQGFLGGLMFWWLKFPSPVLWGLVMGALSIVPVLGSFVIWIPATIFLALESRWGEAVTLALWGAVVIGSADNLVRPLLMGNNLRLHTVPAFIAMLGGLQLFGPTGIVLGPVVMTTTALLLELWRNRSPDYYINIHQ
jgi:predicted PurR-regulated permease PerM